MNVEIKYAGAITIDIKSWIEMESTVVGWELGVRVSVRFRVIYIEEVKNSKLIFLYFVSVLGGVLVDMLIAVCVYI